MSWLAAAGRIIFLLALSAALGSMYGYPEEVVILALLGLFVTIALDRMLRG